MCCKQWTLRKWIYFLRATPTLTLEFAFDSRSAHWELGFAVQARQCPLKSGARSWSSWDLALPVEVRHCPLTSRTRSGDPRLPEEKEKEKGEQEEEEEEEEEEKTTRTRIKSRDPHLAGGEKGKTQYGWNKHNPKIHTNELTSQTAPKKHDTQYIIDLLDLKEPS